MVLKNSGCAGTSINALHHIQEIVLSGKIVHKKIDHLSIGFRKNKDLNSCMGIKKL
jgi:hypothetical protein